MVDKIKSLFAICTLIVGLAGCVVIPDDEPMYYYSYSNYTPYPIGSYEWATDYYHRPPRHGHRIHRHDHHHVQHHQHKHDHNHDHVHKGDKGHHDKPKDAPKHHDIPNDAPKHHDTPKHNVNTKTPSYDFSNHSPHQSHQVKIEKPKAEFKGPRKPFGRR